ncbi:MAG: bifunctional diaminohydroxyphosphoribosylaminopyrimidine deaminase/5-amino-6-(5-phosphoribosylamino)uracil reductase RibD [Eubacterium sp.]|nr:bifunctional diaminohydroxyphosphoribosylaminopyrimidine deaminase/5-amino-6-(5-phosphoribosylamino)uracil reductase RibD [Eubacterium sp.]
MTKYEYMQLAIELAKKGTGHTSPNPMVGCVVVKNGKIVTEGFHEKFGSFHAERNALMNCDEDLTGADLYVTLEPCCHQGKTPPCTDIIIERGIGRVFIGAMDPNPKVSGNGAKILREHGIEVETGILEKECLELNEVFMHYIKKKKPYIAMKYAMTLDGKIATFTGDSKWVTGEEARQHVHQLRKRYSAIMVGIGTILVDNPMLNCRIEEGVNPVRVICDSNLRIPLESEIVKTAKDIRTIVAYAVGDEEKKKKLSDAGVELLQNDAGGRVDFAALVDELGKMGIDSILIEGGGTFHGTVLKSSLVDRIFCYIAPKLIGGKEAKSPVEGSGFSLMKEALEIYDTEILKLGKDICITGKVSKENK